MDSNTKPQLDAAPVPADTPQYLHSTTCSIADTSDRPTVAEIARLVEAIAEIDLARRMTAVFDDPVSLGREHSLRTALNHALAAMLTSNADALQEIAWMASVHPSALCECCGGKVPVLPNNSHAICVFCGLLHTVRWSERFTADGRPPVKVVDVAGQSQGSGAA